LVGPLLLQYGQRRAGAVFLARVQDADVNSLGAGAGEREEVAPCAEREEHQQKGELRDEQRVEGEGLFTRKRPGGMSSLHVEYAERRKKYHILFMFRLFYEYSNLEYVHICVIYRVTQAEYDIRLRMAASQEYVNTYSTRRMSRP